MLAAQKVTVVAPPLEPSEPTLAGRKREREEPSVPTDEGASAGAAAPQAAVSVSAATVELTEESVRLYIASLGGRVTIDALKEVSSPSNIPLITHTHRQRVCMPL